MSDTPALTNQTRAFCARCDREHDATLSECGGDYGAAPASYVRWHCLGCGHTLDMHASWGITLADATYRQQSA